MTPAQLRATIGRLGLSQTGAAALLGVDARTMRRWLAGEREIPPPVDRVLWLLLRHGAGELREFQPRWPDGHAA